jgi:hypothetical protein
MIIRLYDATHPDMTGWNRIRLSTRRDISGPAEITANLQREPSFFHLGARAHERAVRLVEHLAEQAHTLGHSLILSGRTDRPRLYLQIGGVRRTVLISRADTSPHRRARQRSQTDPFHLDAGDQLAIEIARTRYDSDRWTVDSRPLHEQAREIIVTTSCIVERECLLREQRRHDLAEHRLRRVEQTPTLAQATGARTCAARAIVVPTEEARGSRSCGGWP